MKPVSVRSGVFPHATPERRYLASLQPGLRTATNVPRICAIAKSRAFREWQLSIINREYSKCLEMQFPVLVIVHKKQGTQDLPALGSWIFAFCCANRKAGLTWEAVTTGQG